MTLSEALEQVELEPGRTYLCKVQGMTVELTVRPELKIRPVLADGTGAVAVELRDCDLTPNDDWVELPAPKPAFTVKLKKGPPMTAMVLDHTDDQIAPE